MKKIYLLLISLSCIMFGYGQTHTLATFDKTNTSGTTAVDYVENLTATGFSRGSGVNFNAPEGFPFHKTDSWSSASFEGAVTANEYIEWSVTANNNFILTIDELRIQLKNTNSGPSSFKIYFSLDDFITPQELEAGDRIITSTAENYSFSNLNIDSQTGGTITFRLYAWGATNTTSGQLQISGQSSWKMPGGSISSPGSIVRGHLTSTFDGLLYSNGVWFPEEPSLITKEKDVIIQNGTYELSDVVIVKNVTVEPTGEIVIKSTGSLEVNGHLITSDNVSIESTSSRFGGLMVQTYIDEDFEKPMVLAQVTGNVNYSRHVNDIGENDLIAAPVSGQSFADFRAANPDLAQNTAGTKFFFGPFNKITGDYDIYTDTTVDTLRAGMGYRAASKAKDNLTFTGIVTVSRVDVPIEDSGPHHKEWNLIGNPYPSHFSLRSFLSVPQNINIMHSEAKAIYGYNPKNQSQKWVVWNNASVTGNPSLAIAPGQGFYVASNEVGGDIIFRPSMMVSSSSGDFVSGKPGSEDTTAEDTPNYGFIKLNLAHQDNQYYTEIYFNDMSSRGLDPGYDAKVYRSSDFSIYSHLVEDSQGTDMAIQSLAYSDLTNGVTIPIGINVSEGMQATVSISELTIPEGVEVYLEDNLNNTHTLLNDSDYTFTANSDLTDIGRFFLHLSNRALSTPDVDLSGLHIYVASKTNTLFVKGLLKENAQLNIHDIQGRLITTSQLMSNTSDHQMDLSHLGGGVYIIELKSNAFVKTQKVILK